jgi:hypothetical protein
MPGMLAAAACALTRGLLYLAAACNHSVYGEQSCANENILLGRARNHAATDGGRLVAGHIDHHAPVPLYTPAPPAAAVAVRIGPVPLARQIFVVFEGYPATITAENKSRVAVGMGATIVLCPAVGYGLPVIIAWLTGPLHGFIHRQKKVWDTFTVPHCWRSVHEFWDPAGGGVYFNWANGVVEVIPLHNAADQGAAESTSASCDSAQADCTPQVM